MNELEQNGTYVRAGRRVRKRPDGANVPTLRFKSLGRKR